MEAAGLKFLIDCPPLPEPAYVDREMWEKIVLNLVSNAFKFTLAGSIAVRVRDAGGQVRLSVEDTGAGIPEIELPRILDRFHRVEGARGRTHEGSGIGLALVHELAKLHGGSVLVESTVGKGSSFFISVPKGKEHLPPERVGETPMVSSIGVAGSAYVDEVLHWLPESDRPLDSVPPFAADTVHAPHLQHIGGHILLADDNADMRAYVRRLLGAYYEVQAVANGVEALAATRLRRPDLVLTDVMMPALDGFGLLRELRAREDTRTIPVILLSARAGEDARVEGLIAGADDYMVKPFTARELLARVGAHLSMSRLRGEAAERERALRAEAEAAHDRASTILESISDAFFALDREWRFTYVNEAAERSTGMTRKGLTERVFWDVFPASRGTDLETQFRRAMDQRVVTHFQHLYIPWRRWYEIRVYPAKDEGISVFYQDITRRKLAEHAVRQTNEALRAANADLEQFAHSVSHDLREPLRMVSIYCELLSLDYAGKFDARADEMLGYCIEGARRMGALIDALLVYVKASWELEQPAQLVPLEDALDVALLNLEAAIKETGATVTHDSLPAVRVVPVQMQQLFQNLISNGLKYRGEAPPVIHVGARQEESGWTFSVRDNGIGIDAAHKDYIFGVFKRLHSSSEYSGTGLGLAICKKLVERYGGRIWVESEVGQGATFLFTLPEDKKDGRDANP